MVFLKFCDVASLEHNRTSTFEKFLCWYKKNKQLSDLDPTDHCGVNK